MWNAGLHESQAIIKTARRNINNLRYADDATLMAETEEELKSPLMKVKEESEKVGLKLNIQKTKIIWSHHFVANRWGNSGNSARFGGGRGSQITADGDCSHEIKKCLLLGRKAMTNLDSIFKSRDITLPTKVCIVKAMVFPVVMYGCESWTVKKAERGKTDAFQQWCWRRLLRLPWTARSNQAIVREINPEYSLEGLLLKLKLQFFGYLISRVWCWERLRAEGEEGDSITNSMAMNLNKLWETAKDRAAWHAAVHGVEKSHTDLPTEK